MFYKSCARDSFVGQVKSLLLPLTPWARILNGLIECLPRQLIKVELKPLCDIAVINQSKREYKATGFAPRFEMTLTPATLKGNWYYLEAALVRNNGSREIYIRAKTHHKGNESIILPIPANLRGTVREVFFLPPNIKILHWQPTAAPGFFSQSPLLLHKITLLESTLRRMHRVIFDLRCFRNRTPGNRFGLTWWGMVSNLQNAYQCTATLRINRLMGNDYFAFIALKDTLKKEDISAMHKQASQLPLRPVISLIMPVQAPITVFFREALDSVLGQIYPHWELLLIGDFSTNSQSHEIAIEYQNKNTQVKIIPIGSGEGLAKVLNNALKLAEGNFIARINQHDQIPPHALFLLAKEISTYPDADLIYTDDDSIDDTHKRLDPRFKPDWNPDLFFSYNYLTNLTLYRTERTLELGGYRHGFEGAEDYEFSLRYLRGIPAIKIRHIPRVLYHRRVISQPMPLTPSPLRGECWSEGDSTVNLSSAKPSPAGEGWVKGNQNKETAHKSGKRALKAYFQGSGIIVEDGPASGLYRIKHPLPVHPPMVSIIIPTRDKVEILRACIESIQQKTDYDNWEILVVDNQSVESETHTYFEQIQGDWRIRVLRYEKTFNFSAMNNFAVQDAQGEIIALVNNDVEVIANEWLSEMVSHAIRPGIGAVGAKLLYSNNTVQHAGVIIGLGGVAGHGHKFIKSDAQGYCNRAVVTQNLSAVTGACLVVKKNIYEEVGGLNEVDLVVALNDIDFCLKLVVAGYRNVYTPYARLYHYESISRGHDDTPEKQAIFMHEYNYMKKFWGTRLQQDPAYSPNLTLEFEDFSFNSK